LLGAPTVWLNGSGGASNPAFIFIAKASNGCRLWPGDLRGAGCPGSGRHGSLGRR
jgi:hypothetical protein